MGQIIPTPGQSETLLNRAYAARRSGGIYGWQPIVADARTLDRQIEAHERALRACVEALEGDKEEFETLLDGHVDDVSFAAVEQRLTAIRTALALAQGVKEGRCPST